MKHCVYCVENTLSNVNSGLYLFPTDAQAAVDLAATLAPARYSVADKQKYISEELRLFCVGTFDIETRELVPLDAPRFVAWDFRRFVESPMTLNSAVPAQASQEFAAHTEDIK